MSSRSRETPLKFQGLVKQGEPSAWWTNWVLFLLCRISNSLNQMDQLDKMLGQP